MDIVKRLRETYPTTYAFTEMQHIGHEAADEIERLRSALAELVALKDMKDRGFGAHDTEGEDEYMRRKPAAWQAARDALVPNAH